MLVEKFLLGIPYSLSRDQMHLLCLIINDHSFVFGPSAMDSQFFASIRKFLTITTGVWEGLCRRGWPFSWSCAEKKRLVAAQYLLSAFEARVFSLAYFHSTSARLLESILAALDFQEKWTPGRIPAATTNAFAHCGFGMSSESDAQRVCLLQEAKRSNQRSHSCSSNRLSYV